ncbi:MAG: hypothetical protein WDN30_03235 [Pararobbsia sp.]
MDEIILGMIDRLYERAGLFAWRETHRGVLAGAREWLTRRVMRAIGTMPTAQEDVSHCREAALFDPEFGQWHFVSLDGLIE